MQVIKGQIREWAHGTMLAPCYTVYPIQTSQPLCEVNIINVTFMAEKTDSEKLNNFPRVTQLIRAGDRICVQVCASHSP